jgi:putative ABC transport system substrate-binding protein
MKRREFIAGLGVSAAVIRPRGSLAQQPDGVRRVAVLIGAPENDPETKRRIAALVDNLRALGWIEGRNIRFDYRITTDVALMRGYAAETVGLTPDVIVAHSNPFR